MSHKTVFMFSGQGSQYFQMGKQLFEAHAVFRDSMSRLDGLAKRLSGHSVVEAIYGSSKSETFDRLLLTHPAIFMVEYSLAQCLLHEGTKPDLVLGASLGSFAAAAVAGCLQPEDALAAVIEKAKIFEAACEPGGMLSILAEPSLFTSEEALFRHSELAGVSFGKHFTVAAPQAALDAVEQGLKQLGVARQRLAVGLAFHSRWVEDAKAPFLSHLRSVPLRQGVLPLVCCAQAGTLAHPSADFFWRVVRHPIRFKDTIEHLERQGRYRYVDVGPSGTLATFVKYALAPGSESTAHATLTPYGQDLKNLAALAAAR